MSNKQIKLGSNFIGRTELIEWVNQLLDLEYKKVEDTANGAAFCQIVDLIHPGTVPLGRVNFNADLPHESMENLKILQEAFMKNGIKEDIDVASLSKKRYVAALNLLQFLYQYYNQSAVPNDYNPKVRRQQCHCREPTPNRTRNSGSPNRGVPVLTKTIKKLRLSSAINMNKNTNSPVNSPKTVKIETPPPKPSTPSSPSEIPQQPPNSKPNVDLQRLVVSLQRSNKALKEEVKMMTEERDFYYEKLRKVEEFCQDNEDDVKYKMIIDILYETDEAHGFVAPDEEEDDNDVLPSPTSVDGDFEDAEN